MQCQHRKHYLLLFAATAIALTTAPAHAAINLTVNAGDEFKEVTRVGSGSLYGITRTIPADLNKWVKPLNPYMFTNPGLSGQGHQHNNNAAAVPVAERLWDSVPGAVMSITLPDMLPGWPYQWAGWEKWEQMTRQVVTAKRASRAKNFYGYVIWNEPLQTWGTTGISGWNNERRDSYHELWRDTYRLLRQIDPQEDIIGPCFSWYNEGEIERFLNYAKTTSTVPDIMCWHSLGGVAGITKDVADYRKLETKLSIPTLPITLNEYGESHESTETPYEGNPGRSAAFIAKLERLHIHSANISWWHTCCAGRLGSLMANNTQPGAGWYFYKWYGEMSGKMISVTPPNTNTKGVDGFANIDHDKRFISILFGGENSSDRTVNVTFNKLPAWMGTSAKVKIEGVDWKHKDTVSNGPYTISENERPITNNSLTVTVNNCNNLSGYRIYLTPATAGPPCTPNVNCPNLVRDGNFPGSSLNSDNWFIKNTGEGFGATVSVSGGKAVVNITGVGTEVYQPQLVQTGIYPLESGKTYTLSFKASAVSARTMGVVIESNSYSKYAEPIFSLTASEQTFTHTFTMTTSDNDVQLAFNFGGAGASTANITISDVSLAQGNMTSIGGRFASVNTNAARPLVTVRGRILNVSSPNNSELMMTVRVIDVRGKVRAKFDANGNANFLLTSIPAGRYFVDVRGIGIKQTLPIVVK